MVFNLKPKAGNGDLGQDQAKSSKSYSNTTYLYRGLTKLKADIIMWKRLFYFKVFGMKPSSERSTDFILSVNIVTKDHFPPLNSLARVLVLILSPSIELVILITLLNYIIEVWTFTN